MIASYSNLVKLRDFLDKYRDKEQPAAFEYLVASAFSQLLHLPFQCLSNRDDTVKYRVLWYGNRNIATSSITQSRSGPDAVCSAYGFYILLETTLRVGRGQWRKEFIECLRHYDDFVTSNNLNSKDVYLALVAPELHKDLYTGFKQKIAEGYNLALVRRSWLARLWDTSRMIPTLRNLDLREVLDKIMNELTTAPSFDRFKIEVTQTVSRWRREILAAEKNVFFALRAYEAMKRIGGDPVAISDILVKLDKDPMFNRYWEIVGKLSLPPLIKNCLLSEKMAKLANILGREKYFCRVIVPDYRARSNRLVESVEKIGD